MDWVRLGFDYYSVVGAFLVGFGGWRGGERITSLYRLYGLQRRCSLYHRVEMIGFGMYVKG